MSRLSARSCLPWNLINSFLMGLIMDEATYQLLTKISLANRFIPIPPDERNFVGGSGQFLATGFKQVTLLRNFGLRTNSSVLDIGSGIGRLALPLTQYMDETGSYFGVDINLGGIAWCHENITQKYNNFEFVFLDARNDNYRHPHEYGQRDFVGVNLPIPRSRTFDFVTAFSLFTHLQWRETQHYFALISNILQKGGSFVSSWFLIDNEARAKNGTGKPLFKFDLTEPGPVFRLAGTPAAYSKAFACNEEALINLAKASGFEVANIGKHPWRDGGSGQDYLLLKKL
jgi:SAM-dependent methyltransferase